MSNDNVIPFAIQPEKPATESDGAAAATAPEITEKQLGTIQSIQYAVKYLLDNHQKVDYFVLGVATKPDNPDDPAPFDIFASPIEASEFALAVKLLDIKLMDYIMTP